MRIGLLALAIVAMIDARPLTAVVSASAPGPLAIGLVPSGGRPVAVDAWTGMQLGRDELVDPLMASALAGLVLIVLADTIRRRQRMPRRAPMIDADFEARAFVPMNQRDRALDPLRHFHPAAPALATAAVERSRPDYIRAGDAVEVWTPLRVHASRDPHATAGRRRTDAAGANYRFHRVDRDGAVRAAAQRCFASDAEARDFAATSGCVETIEVWHGDRRVATVPPVLVG